MFTLQDHVDILIVVICVIVLLMTIHVLLYQKFGQICVKLSGGDTNSRATETLNKIKKIWHKLSIIRRPLRTFGYNKDPEFTKHVFEVLRMIFGVDEITPNEMESIRVICKLMSVGNIFSLTAQGMKLAKTYQTHARVLSHMLPKISVSNIKRLNTNTIISAMEPTIKPILRKIIQMSDPNVPSDIRWNVSEEFRKIFEVICISTYYPNSNIENIMNLFEQFAELFE